MRVGFATIVTFLLFTGAILTLYIAAKRKPVPNDKTPSIAGGSKIEITAGVLLVLTGITFGATPWGQSLADALGFTATIFSTFFLAIVLAAFGLQTIRIAYLKDGIQYSDMALLSLTGLMMGFTPPGQWILSLIFRLPEITAAVS